MIKSDRQYAATLAKKHFNGQLSKHKALSSFPNHENDFKIRLLYNRIMTAPRRGWLFGISNKAYQQFLNETFDLIEDLETDTLRFKTMKRLLRELWLQSNNCSAPIEHIWFSIQEVGKSTNSSRREIKIYLNLLIDRGYIKKVSITPLLYEFTDKGKTLKKDADIENIIQNVSLYA